MALELTRKSGEKKPKATGQKNDITLKIMSVFEKNPFLKILVPVLLLLILAGVLLFLIFGDGVLLGKTQDAPASPSAISSQNQVDVLPGNNSITDEAVVSLIKDDPLAEDILARASYTGYATGSSGLKTALIQIGDKNDTLVLSTGEKVGDSEWELSEITKDYVIFKAGDKTKKLELK